MGHLIVYIPVPRWHKHLVSQSVPTPSFFGFKTSPVYFLGLKVSLRSKIQTWNHLGIHVFPIVPRWHNQRHGAKWQLRKCMLDTKFLISNFYWAEIVPVLQKKCVWQVTTIIQPALCHLGTSHFLKVLYNKIPKGQIRWPIFLFFMYMLVLPEKLSIFPKSHLFWILVFSCPKMTLITIFTRMTHIVAFAWLHRIFD